VELLERLGPGQLAAVVHLLETMVAPVVVSPEEDGDTLSPTEARAIAEADEWLKHNQPIPHEKVLAEFGLTMAEWEKMSREPYWPNASSGPIRRSPTSAASSSPLHPDSQDPWPLHSHRRRQHQTAQGRHSASDPPRAQDHRVFFRDKGEFIEINRVLDRKEAYR